MVLGHLVQFFTVWQFQGQPPPHKRVVGNSYVYRFVSGNWPPTGTVTASAWIAQVWQSLRTAITTDYQTFGLHVTSPIDGGAIDAPSQVTQPGLRTGPRLPYSHCVRVALKTALRGRSYLGAKLFAPVSQLDVTGDELNGGGLTLWQGAVSVLTADLVYADGAFTQRLRPVVWSRTLTPGPPFVAPAEGADITSVIVDRTIGALRHRKEISVR